MIKRRKEKSFRRLLLLSVPREREQVTQLSRVVWWIVIRCMQWSFISSPYFTLWHTSMSPAKMSRGTCQIFIKLITLSPQTGSDKPGIRARDLRHLSLTVWHEQGDHPTTSEITRVYIFILLYLSLAISEAALTIFTLMCLICIMLQASRVETHVKAGSPCRMLYVDPPPSEFEHNTPFLIKWHRKCSTGKNEI